MRLDFLELPIVAPRLPDPEASAGQCSVSAAKSDFAITLGG